MDERLYFPATERNRSHLLEVMKPLLKETKSLLEIASGSGEHLCHFAPHFPDTLFQPTDIEDDYLKSIKSWKNYLGLKNLNDPFYLDCLNPPQGLGVYEAILCINMIHISPPETLEGVMSICETSLAKGGFLFFYGPFKVGGQHTSESNISFEEWLKEKDSRFSVRNLEDVVEAAEHFGMVLEDKIQMPANNFSLVFRKN